MKLITQNAYRILGINTNSTKRLLQQRLDELDAYKAIGQYPKYDTDIGLLGELDRNEELIDSAKNVINNKDLNFLHSLFWFSNANPVDNMAIDFIKNKKFDMAIPLWDNYVPKFKKNESEGKFLTDDNYHQVKNLALLYLIISLISKYNTIKNTVLGEAARLFEKPKEMLLLSLDLWNQLIISSYFANNYLNAGKNIEKQQENLVLLISLSI